MTIGQRIKNRRIELGMTVDEVAEKLGKNRATVYRYESGSIEDMPSTVLESIADILRTTPADLMGWKDDKNEKIYYLNEETAQMAQEIFDNKELRALFDVQKDMEPEDLQALQNMALALKRKERREDDTGC